MLFDVEFLFGDSTSIFLGEREWGRILVIIEGEWLLAWGQGNCIFIHSRLIPCKMVDIKRKLNYKAVIMMCFLAKNSFLFAG